ncbi:hypothetical protein VHUM_01864 [Vanrija humicola]|uniref:NADP-dependent oxidoreductase domain-containing protein n=1 Tax=Vanrija humicola TaxID=5417 RepID=A0A7D8V2M8_VANHU|nr:hypothetical protein VHUM_01864 [Vanrija humicola]
MTLPSPLAPYHPDQPEPTLRAWAASDIPSDEEDVIPPAEVLPPADGQLPRIILGCAPFGYGIYADKSAVEGVEPVRLVRAALRAGVTAFDTAPYYHPSEIVLGNALHTLADEFPRESYTLITKVSKFGPAIANHVFEADAVRKSVERSLKRLRTDYLDVVYLHDVEFAASGPYPVPAGLPLESLAAGTEGLAPPYTSLGAGDDAILASLAALRELQAEGKIKRVGIAGYTLPVLLRLALLVLHATGRPLDLVQSYSHQTLQNSALGDGYLAALNADARVGQVVNAAPLSMGLLTRSGGPEWHPARKVPKLHPAVAEAADLAAAHGTSIEAVAIAFGYKELRQADGKVVPVVIGCTTLPQLHQALQTFHDINSGAVDEKRDAVAAEITELFKQRGVHNYSWQSPGPNQFE